MSHLPPFLERLLVLLPGLLFLLDATNQKSIPEFRVELIKTGVRFHRKAVLNLEEVLKRIKVCLSELDLPEIIDDLHVILDVLERD